MWCSRHAAVRRCAVAPLRRRINLRAGEREQCIARIVIARIGKFSSWEKRSFPDSTEAVATSQQQQRTWVSHMH